MKIAIGAMSVGDILDRGLKLLLARLATFYAINLIVLSPLIVYQLAAPSLTTAGGAFGALIVFAIAFLLTLILQPVGTGAILHVIAQEFIDQRVGVGAALSFALGRFFRLLGTSILAGLIIGLGSLCIVPGFIFMVWYAFIAQVVVVEALGGEKALSRSKRLTEGFRWRIFGLVVLVVIIQGIIVGLGGALNLVLPSSEQVPVDVPGGSAVRAVFNYRNYAINTLVSQLLNILVASFSAVCFTLMYFDLRIRKEGFDLELAARQQAPTTP